VLHFGKEGAYEHRESFEEVSDTHACPQKQGGEEPWVLHVAQRKYATQPEPI